MTEACLPLSEMAFYMVIFSTELEICLAFSFCVCISGCIDQGSMKVSHAMVGLNVTYSGFRPWPLHAEIFSELLNLFSISCRLL